MPVSFTVYREQGSCKNRNPSYMGAIHGNLRRHPSDIGNERFICEKKRNHRKTLWKCKGESWFSLYTDVWKSPDGNEGRAYICVYEFEKVSKDKGKMGIAGGEKKQQDLYFEHNSFDKRKMALGCESKSHFVYGLGHLHYLQVPFLVEAKIPHILNS